ncbi:hypothetical protein AAVH_14118 [Aphelenchoides avenae]|nr:hypothetical protein AAVH_14118 [Aphelenchus avenae]
MTVEGTDWYCCDDDWAIWRRFETWIWAVLLLVQLSMVAFVVFRGRKDKSFRQAFYVFFVAVTIIDCALALLRPSREFDETIFGTIYDKPMIQRLNTTEPDEPSIRATLNQIVMHAVVPALGHAQPLFLTAIALNRFTAFVFPLKYVSIWRTRTVVVVTISLAAAAIFMGSASLATLAIYQAVKCSGATRRQRDKLGCDLEAWAFQLVRFY